MAFAEGDRAKVTRMRVLRRKAELTGLAAAETRRSGKIDRSAEALLDIS